MNPSSDINNNDTSRFKQLKLLVSTFNMGNARIDNLDHLIPNRGVGLDIIALGFQESVYSISKDTITNSTDNGESSSPANANTKSDLTFSNSSTEVLTLSEPAGTKAESPSTELSSPTSSPSTVRPKSDSILNKIIPSPPSSSRAAVAAATSAATNLVKSKKMITGLENRNQLAIDIGQLLGDNFYMVQLCLNAQMQLIIFAHKSLQADIHHIEVKNENTGFLSIFPNKGGLRISFTIYGTYLTFISCHLAAHEGIKKCHIRNESTSEILGGLRIGDKKFDISCFSHHTIWMGDMNYRITMDKKTPADLDANDKKGVLEVTQADVELDDKADDDDVINSSSNDRSSIGGLTNVTSFKNSQEANNATITQNNNRQYVLQLIAKQDWTALLQYDELNREISGGRALVDFTAIPPTFPPTFKRTRQMQLSISSNSTSPMGSLKTSDDTNNKNNEQQQSQQDKCDKSGSNNTTTTNLKTSSTEGQDEHAIIVDSYNKKRMPSYTDRILYKSLPGFQQHLKVMNFESVESIISSDHKPVRAYFNLTATSLVVPTTNENNFPSKSTSNRTNATKNMIELQIHGLKCKNLKEMDSQLSGGLSDPYIVLHTDPVTVLDTAASNNKKNKLKTSVIKKNINPEWNNEVLTVLLSDNGFATTNNNNSDGSNNNVIPFQELLKQSGHLFVSVWDYDMTTADDLIGVCCLSFQEIFTSSSSSSSSFAFSRNIFNNGLITGTIEGIVTIVSTASGSDGNTAVNNNSSVPSVVLNAAGKTTSVTTTAVTAATANQSIQQQYDDNSGDDKKVPLSFGKSSAVLPVASTTVENENDSSRDKSSGGVKIGCRDRIRQQRDQRHRCVIN